METKPAWDVPLREKDLQRQIIQYIALATPSVLVYQFAGAGTHGALRGSVPSGWPDLLLIIPKTLPPTYLHVEVKTPRGKLSDSQTERYRELVRAGCEVWVWRSVGEAAATLRGLGLQLRVGP